METKGETVESFGMFVHSVPSFLGLLSPYHECSWLVPGMLWNGVERMGTPRRTGNFRLYLSGWSKTKTPSKGKINSSDP